MRAFKQAELRRFYGASDELPVTTLHIGVHRTTADSTWRTPGRIFAELDTEFDFTLDPAASAPVKPGIEWFGETDQGLWQPWAGRVFVNPPYGRAIQDWMRKISLERERCEVIVALLPARTDTEWWHEHVMSASEIRFIRGRLSFEGVAAPKGHNAPFPSVIAVYRTSARTVLCAACRAIEGHRRLAHDGHPEWAVGDWHCLCGWWGNLGWSGFGAHLSDVVGASA